MKQSKCSMQKKKESLSKKFEANMDDLKGMVVSEGTMGVNALIRKYLDVLETYAPDNYKAYIEANPELKDRDVWMALDVRDKSYIVDELADELDKIAPEGYYFGASEGDGACYGFWEVEPDESKKPEACKGGKKDDKKDGKAAESKKCEKVIVNWDILERVFRSLLGKSITDARNRLDIAGWELIRKDVSGKVWEFSDGYNTIRVIGDPVNRVSLLGDTSYSIALPTINNKAAESKKSEADEHIEFKQTEFPKELRKLYKACSGRFYCEPYVSDMLESSRGGKLPKNEMTCDYTLRGSFGSDVALSVNMVYRGGAGDMTFTVSVSALDETTGRSWKPVGDATARSFDDALNAAMSEVDKNLMPFAVKVRSAKKGESKKSEDSKWVIELPSKSSVDKESAVLREKGIPFKVSGTAIFIKPSAEYDNILKKLYGSLMDKSVSVSTSESKKSEGIGDYIKMNIDYNTFMRLLDAAAYLEADDDYKDALWEYFSKFGELDGDACEFFDNLFQYTDWYTAEEVWENYDHILGTKPEDKDAEEALDAYLEEHGDDLGGASVYKHGDHYLILQ